MDHRAAWDRPDVPWGRSDDGAVGPGCVRFRNTKGILTVSQVDARGWRAAPEQARAGRVSARRARRRDVGRDEGSGRLPRARSSLPTAIYPLLAAVVLQTGETLSRSGDGLRQAGAEHEMVLPEPRPKGGQLADQKSGKQYFDLDRGVAGGHLAVKGCQRGVASLGKGGQVVIGPQLVALVITRGDRTPDRVQFGWLVSP